MDFDADVVNRELFDFTSADLIAKCRADLFEHQICILPDFLTERAISQMVAFAEEEKRRAGSAKLMHSTIYYQEPDLRQEINPNHPQNSLVTRSNTYITADKIPTNMGLRLLQDDLEFKGFLEQITKTSLKEYNCKVSKFVFSISGHGDHQDWHFDNNFLTLTFMLQKPQRGGLLEMYPRIGRTNYPEIAKVLALEKLKAVTEPSDDRKRYQVAKSVRARSRSRSPAKAAYNLNTEKSLVSYDYEVGDCVLFFGRESLHRSTTVEGDQNRLIAIISFNTEEFNCMPNSTHMKKVYGLDKNDLDHLKAQN